MRLNLQRLDTAGLELVLGSNPASEHRISLGETKGLRGALFQQEDSLRLSDVAAESLLVSLLELNFETFAIVLRAQGAVSELSGSYERRAAGTELHLLAASLVAPELAAEFGEHRIWGTLRAENLRLDLAGSEGRARAEVLELEDLRLIGASAFSAEGLVAKDVDVSWSSGGYQVTVGELRLPKARAETDLSALRRRPLEDRRTDPANPRSGASFMDWNVLDGLSGTADVDVLVDMRVPVLGSRKAKHPFRLFFESGALNYLQLERGLSALEDALLDFAVRDGALVLERGIPLLPTRGKGKKIMTWRLSADDVELANQHRVRLAVLPRGRLAHAEEASAVAAAAEEGASANGDQSLVLRKLSLVDIQALLRLGPASAATTPIRELSFEELLVQGSVSHEPAGEPPHGEVTGQLRGLKGKVVQLPLGAGFLDLGALHLGRLDQIEVPFRGIHPQALTLELADLELASLSIGK